MQDADLHVLPGPPHAGLKRRVLDELMRNPFLDDDLQMLSARLGAPRLDLSAALAGLSTARFVRPAGAGYMIDTEIESELDEDEVDPQKLLWEAPEAPWKAPEQQLPPDAGLSAPVFLPLADAPATQELVEALPIGNVVLNEDGVLELVNRKASDWLGLPGDVLDGATFEITTGVNPMVVLAGSPISFSITEPHPVEISIRPCRIETGDAVLVVVRDTTMQEEVTKIQASLQEQIFDEMREEMVTPLVTIEKFLDQPDASTLVQARAAMEQVNWFLRQFFLRDEPR